MNEVYIVGNRTYSKKHRENYRGDDATVKNEKNIRT